jgi:hypothetical protein
MSLFIISKPTLLKTTTTTTPNPDDPPVCGHIFTTYIVPDVLHCAAFLIGLVYFRITEGEQMYSLMEKVWRRIKYRNSVCFFF